VSALCLHGPYAAIWQAVAFAGAIRPMPSTPVSLKCDDFTDIVFVLPDNKTKPMYALFDSKRIKKTDAIIFDPSRTGSWKFSYWDINLDNTFPLEGIHANGDLKPVKFVKRCSGQALPNFRCS
jgi:hypothetical protein